MTTVSRPGPSRYKNATAEQRRQRMTEIEARCERQSRETAEALEQGSCFRPYKRGTDMAVHNHLHQIEAVMRQYGGEQWQTFEGNPEIGRASCRERVCYPV